MEMLELFERIANSDKSGKALVTGALKVYPPNGKTKLSLKDTKEMKIMEDDDFPLPKHPIYHAVMNRYYMKKIGQQGWKYVGESNDWLNMCEISVSSDILDGKGMYALKGIAYGENDSIVYYSTDTCMFEIV